MLCEARNILRLRRVHSVNEDLDGLVHEIPATIPWPQAPWPTNVATTFLSQANFGDPMETLRHQEAHVHGFDPRPLWDTRLILMYFARFAADKVTVTKNSKFWFSAENSFALVQEPNFFTQKAWFELRT